MSPAVKILYRTVQARAQHPMVVLHDPTELEAIRAEVLGLMDQVKLTYVRRFGGAIETAEGWRLLFVSTSDIDSLCGVRSDLVFARLSEWTKEAINGSLKPFLTGGCLRGWKVTAALLKSGHMADADLRPTSIDDYLVNLDLP